MITDIFYVFYETQCTLNLSRVLYRVVQTVLDSVNLKSATVLLLVMSHDD